MREVDKEERDKLADLIFKQAVLALGTPTTIGERQELATRGAAAQARMSWAK
jgi:hypothetical protein